METIVSRYTTAAFNSLPDFEINKQRANEKVELMNEFGIVLRKHKVERFLGIALVHKHFPLETNERVVEEVRSEASYIQPRIVADETIITPYLWCVSANGGAKITWTPMEFVLSSSLVPSVRSFASELPSRFELLNELGEVLILNDAQDIFGLALLHRQRIQLDQSKQVLLETGGSTTVSYTHLTLPTKRIV